MGRRSRMVSAFPPVLPVVGINLAKSSRVAGSVPDESHFCSCGFAHQCEKHVGGEPQCSQEAAPTGETGSEHRLQPTESSPPHTPSRLSPASSPLAGAPLEGLTSGQSLEGRGTLRSKVVLSPVVAGHRVLWSVSAQASCQGPALPMGLVQVSACLPSSPTSLHRGFSEQLVRWVWPLVGCLEAVFGECPVLVTRLLQRRT